MTFPTFHPSTVLTAAQLNEITQNLGSAASLAAGGPNGAAQLDSSGNATALDVVAIGSSGPVSLGKVASFGSYSNRFNGRQFYISGSNQQTTGSISSGSNILTLSSALDYVNGQGIRIDGAGIGGDGTRLLATIISGAGTTTLTLSASATSTVTSASVWHDDTTALQNAINYLGANGGGRLDLDAGVFNLGGGLQNQSFANAVITLPAIATGSDVSIEIIGTGGVGFFEEIIPNSPPTNGTVFVFPYICTGGSGIAQGIAYGPFGSANQYMTYFNLRLSNMMFLAPTRSGYNVLGLQGVANAELREVSVSVNAASSSIPLPTNTKEAGISLPGPGNNCRSYCEGVYSQGFYAGITTCDHCILNGVFIQSCVQGVAVVGGEHVHTYTKLLVQNSKYIIGYSANDVTNVKIFTVLGWIDTEADLNSGATFKYVSFLDSNINPNGKIFYTQTSNGTGTLVNTGVNMVFSPSNGGSCNFEQLGNGATGENIVQFTAGASPDSVVLHNSAQVIIQGSGLSGVTITRNSSTVSVPVCNNIGSVPSSNINVVSNDTLVITWATTAPTITVIPLK